jgi:hypothetical protein
MINPLLRIAFMRPYMAVATFVGKDAHQNVALARTAVGQMNSTAARVRGALAPLIHNQASPAARSANSAGPTATAEL